MAVCELRIFWGNKGTYYLREEEGKERVKGGILCVWGMMGRQGGGGGGGLFMVKTIDRLVDIVDSVVV